MRTKIVAGNWKMNLTFEQADDLVNEILDYLKDNPTENGVIVCPPACYLELASDLAFESEMFVGAQNISQHASGAYTGEISAAMLLSMDVNYAIIGHSERRKYFGESNEMLAAKVDQALKHEISPIFCCGEQLAERQQGNHFDVVKNQLQESVFHLDKVDFGNLIIAYEPVWAIGTGENATPEQAQEMHSYIRSLIRDKYNEEVAENTTILYGGSCNPKNAKELFANPDVDGGLIGGASLKSDDFIKIIEAL
ncbi:MAG: triose-phosphate isomerase [Bacteroidales bacterium]|nr:triose-phosphate isomerase [Bacteroidales bacterium]